MIELSNEQRKDAVQSLQQYFEHNMPEPVGNLAASMLLDFVLKEIGPLVYNKGVSDAQIRIQNRIAEIDSELYEAPFTYWLKTAKRSR